jgi:hypothetical protein
MIRMEAAGNLFDGRHSVMQVQLIDQPPSPEEAGKILKNVVGWSDQRNLYPDERLRSFLRFDLPPFKGSELQAVVIQDLADWQRFWELADTGSSQGEPRYKGGDLYSKAALDPTRLRPDDFRLRPDSPGYRAGKDGKDLGADVDLVGPGAAYERWKKTPEYQEWLKDAGHVN